MSIYDWTRFSKSIVIQADKADVYARFCTQQGMESWFLRKCAFTRNGKSIAKDEYVRTGDDYLFLWHGWSDDTFEKGHWLRSNGTDQLGFTFSGHGATQMEVYVVLESLVEGTLVTLTQINIPDDEISRHQWHLGCMEGWIFYLTNLKSVLEGGLDLRNKNSSIKNVFNA